MNLLRSKHLPYHTTFCVNQSSVVKERSLACRNASTAQLSEKLARHDISSHKIHSMKRKNRKKKCQNLYHYIDLRNDFYFFFEDFYIFQIISNKHIYTYVIYIYIEIRKIFLSKK